VFLQSLRNVIAIPDLSRLVKLRRLSLENMRALVDVSALWSSRSLTEFIHVCANNMQPEQYEDLDKISTLERVLVGFDSKKRNREFEAMMRRAGKERFKGGKFVFKQ
jgi:hypothetical protein